MDLGYARVSTTKQDLDRQIVALEAAGIPPERIYVDKKSGATTNRPGLQAVLDYARAGDVIVVHTLDRLGRTVRDTLNLIHDLAERGVGVRNLADPIKVDSANPDDPMGQLAVVMLALFAQMERTYSLERAAGARAAAAAKGRRIGRPSVVDPDKLAYAAHLRDTGSTIAEIIAKTGITRTSLYRHLPPRPAPPVTAADTSAPSGTEPPAQTQAEYRAEPVLGVRRLGGMLESITWPADYAPPCPTCQEPTSGLRETRARVHGQVVIVAIAEPCRHPVDEHAAALQAGAPRTITA
jgi:DNA invertase Pin-like site-specific DNA recombinase